MSRPHVTHSWPEDEAAQRSILDHNERLMRRLAEELRYIRETTAGDRNEAYHNSTDSEAVAQIDDDDGTSEGVLESRDLNAQMYRASSALLAVYDKLGPVALAQTIVALKEFQKDGSEVFDAPPEVHKALSEFYPIKKPAPVAEEAPAGVPTPPPAPTLKQRVANIDRRYFLVGSIIGAGSLIASMGVSQQGVSMLSTDELRKEKREKQRESIKLRTQEKLTPEQKEALLTLQEIEIPDIDQRIADNQRLYGEGRGFMWMGLALTASSLLIGLPPRQAPTSDQPQTQVSDASVDDGEEAAFELRHAMEALDETLEQACLNASPSIREITAIPRSVKGRA